MQRLPIDPRVSKAVLALIVPSRAVSVPMRRRLMQACGVHLDDSAWICEGTEWRCDDPGDITVGRETFVNYGSLIDASWGPIEIGAEVWIAPRVTLVTASHEIGPASRRAGAFRRLPLSVGDGCWLGLGSTVLPGVTVAPGCVIAAGAVVARDTAPDGLYAGVPARRLRDLPPEGIPQPLQAPPAGA